MTTKEKINKFNLMWDRLISAIGDSPKAFRKRRVLEINDFYFSRTNTPLKKGKDKFNCLWCYYNKDTDKLADSVEQRIDAYTMGRNIYISKEDLLSYYLNGWNKNEELKDRLDSYKENKSNYISFGVNGVYAFEEKFLECREKMRREKREVNRILNEKRAVRTLFLFLKLAEKIELKNLNLAQERRILQDGIF